MEDPEWELLIYAAHKVKKISSTILFLAKDFQSIYLSSVFNKLCKWKNGNIQYLWCSQKGEIWLWHSNKGTNSRKFSYWCGHRRNLAGSRPAHTVHRLNIMVLTSTVRLVHIRCCQKREKDISTLNDISNYAIMAGLYRIARRTLLKSEKRNLPWSKYKNYLVLPKMTKFNEDFRWL